MPRLSEERKEPDSGLDERSVARKFGIRELVWPDNDQIRTLLSFFDDAIANARCGAVPKLAVMVLHDYLQGTITRQHITKGPRMSQQEFDVLQAPYYLAARIVTKIQREQQTSVKDRVYQDTWVSLARFIETLRNILDPGCHWLRRSVPEAELAVMTALRSFLVSYPEQRRRV